MKPNEPQASGGAAAEEESAAGNWTSASAGIGGIAVVPLLKLLVDSQKLAPSVVLTLFSQDEDILLERTLTVHELAFLSATFMETAAETLESMRKAVTPAAGWAVARGDFEAILERARAAATALQDELGKLPAE